MSFHWGWGVWDEVWRGGAWEREGTMRGMEAEKCKSERRCSTVGDWCWTGGKGRGPSLYARLAAALLRQLFPGSLWPLSGLGPCSRAGPGASGPCSGPGASGLGLGLECGLGLGSWPLLPAWAWEPLLVGATPHSCSTSPRRTRSLRIQVRTFRLARPYSYMESTYM